MLSVNKQIIFMLGGLIRYYISGADKRKKITKKAIILESLLYNTYDFTKFEIEVYTRTSFKNEMISKELEPLIAVIGGIALIKEISNISNDIYNLAVSILDYLETEHLKKTNYSIYKNQSFKYSFNFGRMYLENPTL
jgi:hypothetical protein